MNVCLLVSDTLSGTSLFSVFCFAFPYFEDAMVWFCVQFLAVADVWENAEGRTFTLACQSILSEDANVRRYIVVVG
jgi:hypothetical protein